MKNTVLILALLVSLVAKSQQDSIRKSRVVQDVYLHDDLSQEFDFESVDTIIKRFYRFDEDGMDGIVATGNPGGAKGFLSPQELRFGFNFGEDVFNTQFHQESQNRMYNTNIPFARIAYLSGPKKYQNFNLLFTENVSSQMNFAVRLDSYGSDGFYLNQQSNNKLFSIQNSFKSRTNKYGYFVKYTVQSGSINENGGIKGDSIYLNNLNTDKLNVQVWFDELSENRYDRRIIDVAQFYRFGKPDSSHNKYDGIFLLLENKGFIENFWYDNQRPDSTYFAGFNINVNDSTLPKVTDRAYLFASENDFLVKYRSSGGRMDIRFGYGLDIFKPETFTTDTVLVTQSLKGILNEFWVGKFALSGIVDKGIVGYNSDGHQIDVSVQRLLVDDKLSIRGYYNSRKSLPDYKMMKYAGNAISWDNGFGYINTNALGLEARFDSIGTIISGSITQTNNYTYFGSDARPVQYAENFGRYELKIKKNFTIKSVHFDANLTYQSVAQDAPINIPNWIWSLSFYYQRYLFNNALEFRLGLDYWQNSSYTADYYIPFTRSFIYQTGYAVGNYPYVDVYVSARIKGAQGFVKFQNVGQLFLNQSYMMVPLYPMQDFGMSFGLRWDFFN